MYKLGWGLDFGKSATKVVALVSSKDKIVERVDSCIPTLAYFDSGKKEWHFGADAEENSIVTKKSLFNIWSIVENIGNKSFYESEFPIGNIEGFTQEEVLNLYFDYILKNEIKNKIIDNLENKTFDKDNLIVFTCPNDRRDEQTDFFEKALIRLGYEVVKAGVSDPIAASMFINYEAGENRINSGKFLVVDIGSRVSDCAFVDCNILDAKVIPTNTSVMEFGGDDFDELIKKYVLEEAAKNDLPSPSQYQMHILNNDCRIAKEILTTANQAIIMYDAGFGSLNITITKERFLGIIKESKILETLKEKVVKLLKENKGVKDLIVVGGASSMELVVDAIKEICDKKGITLHKVDQPNLATARGAALEASGLYKADAVTTKRYGIKIKNDHGDICFSEIIGKNVKLPMKEVVFERYTAGKTKEIDICFAETTLTEKEPLWSKVTPLLEDKLIYFWSVPADHKIEIKVSINGAGIARVEFSSYFSPGKILDLNTRNNKE